MAKRQSFLVLDKAEFLQYMAQHQVSPFQFTPEELAEELGPIQ